MTVTSETINVRPREMREEDASEIAALCGQLGYTVSAEEVLERFKAIQLLGNHKLIVAEAKKVVGWVHIFPFPTLEMGLSTELGGLVVDEGHRGKGVGKVLMAAAEKWSLDRNYPILRFTSRKHRKEAHEFYKSIGYKQIKESLYFEKVLR